MTSRWQPAVGLLLFSLHLPAWALEEFPDYDYQDKKNADNTLVVFFAGLGGKGSWTKFTELMDADPAFDDVGYLAYHSPKSMNIDENIQRAETILGPIRSSYAETIFVGHSIGGIMIKRALLREAQKSPDTRRLPAMVITFGTPLDTDAFTVSVFKKLGAKIFWSTVPRLSREVFSVDRLKEINSSWRIEVKTSPINQIKHVSIFGTSDETAPIDGEGISKDTVFIKGDHRGIITPENREACSWIVFKTVILDRSANPNGIDCTVPRAHGG